MKKPLSHLAAIQTGVFAKTIAVGDIVYLQAKHFDENGVLLNILHPDLLEEGISNKHILQPGDVLFAAKGTKNFATVYESKNPTAVASTTFFVIRISDSALLPEYLAWTLNHPNTQSFLKRNAIGSAMLSISKAVLGDLEIMLPTIEKQKCILKIAALSKKETAILQNIAELKQNYIQQQITNLLK